jgi:hypothetical protein
MTAKLPEAAVSVCLLRGTKKNDPKLFLAPSELANHASLNVWCSA